MKRIIEIECHGAWTERLEKRFDALAVREAMGALTKKQRIELEKLNRHRCDHGLALSTKQILKITGYIQDGFRGLFSKNDAIVAALYWRMKFSDAARDAATLKHNVKTGKVLAQLDEILNRHKPQPKKGGGE